MIRLKSRVEACIGGFVFIDAPIDHNPLTDWSFQSLVNTVIARRKKNPRFGLPLDITTVSEEVDHQNAMRMQGIRGGNHYVLNNGHVPAFQGTFHFTPLPVPVTHEYMGRIATLNGQSQPSEPRVAVAYVHVVGDSGHETKARRFIQTWNANPPGAECGIYVVCNGREAQPETVKLFSELPNVQFLSHDDSGWDIGAFIAAANTIDCDLIACFGGNSHFRKAGWLNRFFAAYSRHGAGLYGSLGTFEVSPHLNTTGFVCSPELLRWYPVRVTTKEHRYDFEHGPNALWKMVFLAGLPAKLVTWDGEYDWWEWRNPANIYRRGDQSNCLTFFNHTDLFDSFDQNGKNHQGRLADTIIDPVFIHDFPRKTA